MRTDFDYPSQGEGRIHGCQWTPEGEIRGVVQIIHGIAEHVYRYDDFAAHLNEKGYVVVAEDHMGHGLSMDSGTPGYFAGGWNAAVEDSYTLLRRTMEQYPDVPCFLFGHSMGSFLARSILIAHPDSGLRGAVICGTGWMPQAVIQAGHGAAELVCRRIGARKPSQRLQNLVFGSYNKRVEHPRTPYDWLSRDSRQVDAYIADPKCGFTVRCGLLRDMLGGISMIQRKDNLAKMSRELPVLFVAGGDDPVGNYGRGVRQAADAFEKAGMTRVECRLFPLCRHEILNEINREEIYRFVSGWLDKNL